MPKIVVNKVNTVIMNTSIDLILDLIKSTIPTANEAAPIPHAVSIGIVSVKLLKKVSPPR